MANNNSDRPLSASDFELLGIIGRGYFGEVRLVRYKQKDQICAMKVLRKAEVVKKNKIEHLIAERNVLAIADSPWVVKLLYSFQDKANLYLVMELLQGGDLLGRLFKKNYLSEDEVRFYISELAIAVHSVHEMNYVHRDLKPDNILIDDDGHIKLTDFGLSSLVDSSCIEETKMLNPRRRTLNWTDGSQLKLKTNRRLFSTVGTLAYTAPEVLAHSTEGYSTKCDWWSVGVIMFELLFGDTPFQTGECWEILKHKLTFLFPIHGPKISKEAQDLLKHLICDEKDRFEFEEMKSHAFFEGVDWEALRSQEAPWIPEIQDRLDVAHLDCFEPVDKEELAERPLLHEFAPLSRMGSSENCSLAIGDYNFRRSRDWQSFFDTHQKNNNKNNQ
jgi:serine/threonine protein kinase